MTDRVLYEGGAHTVVHLPINRRGKATRVSSATYSIVDAREDEDGDERIIVASTSAILDPLSTTLTAFAGQLQADPSRLVVSDAGDFVEGHQYILTYQGSSELFTVDRIDTANSYVYCKNNIRGDYGTGGTVQGIELSGSFPSIEASDEDSLNDGAGPYLVLWSYSIAGEPYFVPSTVYLTRTTLQPSVCEQDILDALPTLQNRLGKHIKLPQLIEFATSEFESAIRDGGREPADFLGGEVAKLCVVYRTVANALSMFGSESDQFLVERFDNAYTAKLASLRHGQAPRGVVDIDPVSNTKKVAYGRPLIRRS